VFTLPLQASAAGEVAVTIGDYGVLPAFADQDGTQIAGSGAPPRCSPSPSRRALGRGIVVRGPPKAWDRAPTGALHRSSAV